MACDCGFVVGGGSMQMMISDVTYAIDYEVAADLVEVLDLEFPEEKWLIKLN